MELEKHGEAPRLNRIESILCSDLEFFVEAKRSRGAVGAGEDAERAHREREIPDPGGPLLGLVLRRIRSMLGEALRPDRFDALPRSGIFMEAKSWSWRRCRERREVPNLGGPI
jgi:hypothetical protein